MKTLFALSCNTCAYPGCEEQLTNPSWQQVKADVAHISGEKAGAARYEPTMNEVERQGYDNLLLLCPNHHRLIDRLEPERHPMARLRDIKAKHEERCREASTWATAGDLERFARLVLDTGRTPPAGEPELRLERSGRDGVELVNLGDGDAFDITVEPVDTATAGHWIAVGQPPRRLSPGARWRAGAYAATLGSAGPHVLRLTWRGADGRQDDAEFPL